MPYKRLGKYITVHVTLAPDLALHTAICRSGIIRTKILSNKFVFRKFEIGGPVCAAMHPIMQYTKYIAKRALDMNTIYILLCVCACWGWHVVLNFPRSIYTPRVLCETSES